jgi:hypothetical protein
MLSFPRLFRATHSSVRQLHLLRVITLTVAIGSLAVATITAPGFAAPADAPAMVDPAIDKPGPFSYLAKPSTTIGLMGSERAAQITFDGAIYTGAAELCFFSGEPLKSVMVRQKTLADGWLPIVQYSWQDGPTSYSLECFGAPLREDNPLTPTLNFVRVHIQNTGTGKATAHFAAGLRFTGEDHRFGRLAPYPYNPDWKYEVTSDTVLRNGEALLFFAKPSRVEAAAGTPYTQPFTGRDLKLAPRSECCLLHYTPELAAGESTSIDFKMPLMPLDAEQDSSAARTADYDSARAKTSAWWKDLQSKGTQISIPERKVQETNLASLMYDWMAIVQTKDGWKQQVNKLHYSGFWLRDAAYITRSYDLLGYFDIAEKTLRYFLQFQKPDGLFMSQPGQQDGIGNAMWSLGHHYLLTGDTSWAKEIYHVYAPQINWLKLTRSADEFHILPPTHAHDNEQIQGRYTGYNFWALLGIRTGARLAQALGKEDDFRNFMAEYQDYRTALMAQLEKVSGKDGYIPPGLDVKGGEDWANLTGVYPSEVLPKDDPRIGATLAKVHKDKYQEGIMTYAGKLHLYITVKATENHIIRGEQEQALRDFYSFLLHTGSCHEGFEFGAQPWGDRDVYHNFTPHGWGAAMYNIMLRNMLVNEQGGNGGLEPRDLHLFSVVSPAWAKPGQTISISNAPTECGTVSASMTFAADGASVKYKSDYRTPPRSLVLHVPYFVELTSCTAQGGTARVEKDHVVLSPGVTSVDLKWTVREHPDLSYERIVSSFRDEYARRYADYVKNGGKPLRVEPPQLQQPDDRDQTFQRLYGRSTTLSTGKPVIVSGGTEEGHGPEYIVDGDTSDPHKSWWAGPPLPRSATIDLQKPERIAGIQVFPYWDGTRWYMYTVEVSEDNKTWQKIANKTDKNIASDTGDLYEFPPLTARYVKVTLRRNSANKSAHLVEVRVFPAKT